MLVVASGQNVMWEYIWNDFSSAPVQQLQYELDSDLISAFNNNNLAQKIELNSDFIVVQSASVLRVYRRGVTCAEFVVAGFNDVAAFSLLGVDNLLLLRKQNNIVVGGGIALSTAEYYSLAVVPTMLVKLADQGNLENVVLTATSWSGNQAIECSQTFNVYPVSDENSKDVYTSGLEVKTQIDFLSYQPLTKVPIGQDLVGPNIFYG